jgi:hypothetical protein
MLIIETHDTRTEAEQARRFYVKAQRQVDKVWERIWGCPVYLAPEDTYKVVPEGDRFAVAVDDPSLPQ